VGRSGQMTTPSSPHLEPPARRAVLRPVGHLAIALLAVQAALAAINLSPLIGRYTVDRPFDMNAETTLPSWFSAALLLAIAAVAAAARHYGAWGEISLFFLLLSADEAASLHELPGEKASRFLDIEALPSP